MRTFAVLVLALATFGPPAPAEAVRGTRIRIKSGGPGKGNADRTRIDVRSGHDRTKIDVRGDRVRIDVRDHDRRRHDARLRVWRGWRARFGPRFVVTAPLRVEFRAHARRIAWLRRIRVVAVSAGDAEAATRVDALLVRANARHDIRVAALVEVR